MSRPIRIFVLFALLAGSLLAVPTTTSAHEGGEAASESEDTAWLTDPVTPPPTPSIDATPVPGSDELEETLNEQPGPTATPSLDGESDGDEHKASSGQTNQGAPTAVAPAIECQDGFAGPFPCKNIDLLSALSLDVPPGGTDNDVWGWTDPKTGREYAIVGGAVATAFVDVTDPENPRMLGSMPTSGVPDFVLWRDMKVDGNYVFVVSEITDHGMQVFDLRNLRGVEVPQVFSADTVYKGEDEVGNVLSNAHNIVINEKTDFAYIVGSNTCVSTGAGGQGGGLHMVDISDPENPEFAGCAIVEDPASHNYIHDAQCVVYKGPDKDYTGRELCFGSNEEVVVIYDVTNKNSPVVINQIAYPEAAYTHQGWLTADQRFFLFGDEGDETGATVDNTTTYIYDAVDLDDSSVRPKPFAHETRSIDHNLFIHKGLVHQSNYAAGLRILDFSTSSLKNGKLNEVGFFDTRPGVDEPEFVGTWSNYPYFKSGINVTTDIEAGSLVLFVLGPTGPAAGDTEGTGGNKNNDGNKNKDKDKAGNKNKNGDTAERPPTTVASSGGSALANTGAKLTFFLLLGLALVAAGLALQKHRREESSP